MSAFPTFTRTFQHAPYAAIDPQNPSVALTGRVVFITGGGKGIGKAIAVAFAKAGASTIIITGRTEAALLSAKTEIEQEATGSLVVRALPLDITNHQAVEGIFSQVAADIGPISILVNNAGYLSQHVDIASSDLADYWLGFETNVQGSLNVTQAFLRSSHTKDATLINITSGASHIPFIPGYSGYSASKLAFVKIMDYVQSENPSLRVFNVQPGTVDTDMTEKSGGDIIPEDDISLPGCFCVWLASRQSDFLRGRLIWSNWDVIELKQMESKIVEGDLLKIKLDGWN